MKNINQCECGKPFHVLDSVTGEDSMSTTAHCKCCERYFLTVQKPAWNAVIHLRDFHLKRGEARGQRPLHDHQMAVQLIKSFMFHTPISPATSLDFGIQSPSHLGALQHAWYCGADIYEFDRILGDGPAITELVSATPQNPFVPIEFKTPYDDISLLTQ